MSTHYGDLRQPHLSSPSPISLNPLPTFPPPDRNHTVPSQPPQFPNSPLFANVKDDRIILEGVYGLGGEYFPMLTPLEEDLLQVYSDPKWCRLYTTTLTALSGFDMALTKTAQAYTATTQVSTYLPYQDNLSELAFIFSQPSNFSFPNPNLDIFKVQYQYDPALLFAPTHGPCGVTRIPRSKAFPDPKLTPDHQDANPHPPNAPRPYVSPPLFAFLHRIAFQFLISQLTHAVLKVKASHLLRNRERLQENHAPLPSHIQPNSQEAFHFKYRPDQRGTDKSPHTHTYTHVLHPDTIPLGSTHQMAMSFVEQRWYLILMWRIYATSLYTEHFLLDTLTLVLNKHSSAASDGSLIPAYGTSIFSWELKKHLETTNFGALLLHFRVQSLDPLQIIRSHTAFLRQLGERLQIAPFHQYDHPIDLFMSDTITQQRYPNIPVSFFQPLSRSLHYSYLKINAFLRQRQINNHNAQPCCATSTLGRQLSQLQLNPSNTSSTSNLSYSTTSPPTSFNAQQHTPNFYDTTQSNLNLNNINNINNINNNENDSNIHFSSTNHSQSNQFLIYDLPYSTFAQLHEASQLQKRRVIDSRVVELKEQLATTTLPCNCVLCSVTFAIATSLSLHGFLPSPISQNQFLNEQYRLHQLQQPLGQKVVQSHANYPNGVPESTSSPLPPTSESQITPHTRVARPRQSFSSLNSPPQSQLTPNSPLQLQLQSQSQLQSQPQPQPQPPLQHTQSASQTDSNVTCNTQSSQTSPNTNTNTNTNTNSSSNDISSFPVIEKSSDCTDVFVVPALVRLGSFLTGSFIKIRSAETVLQAINNNLQNGTIPQQRERDPMQIRYIPELIGIFGPDPVAFNCRGDIVDNGVLMEPWFYAAIRSQDNASKLPSPNIANSFTVLEQFLPTHPLQAQLQQQQQSQQQQQQQQQQQNQDQTPTYDYNTIVGLNVEDFFVAPQSVPTQILETPLSQVVSASLEHVNAQPAKYAQSTAQSAVTAKAIAHQAHLPPTGHVILLQWSPDDAYFNPYLAQQQSTQVSFNSPTSPHSHSEFNTSFESLTNHKPKPSTLSPHQFQHHQQSIEVPKDNATIGSCQNALFPTFLIVPLPHHITQAPAQLAKTVADDLLSITNNYESFFESFQATQHAMLQHCLSISSIRLRPALDIILNPVLFNNIYDQTGAPALFGFQSYVPITDSNSIHQLQHQLHHAGHDADLQHRMILSQSQSALQLPITHIEFTPNCWEQYAYNTLLSVLSFTMKLDPTIQNQPNHPCAQIIHLLSHTNSPIFQLFNSPSYAMPVLNGTLFNICTSIQLSAPPPARCLISSALIAPAHIITSESTLKQHNVVVDFAFNPFLYRISQNTIWDSAPSPELHRIPRNIYLPILLTKFTTNAKKIFLKTHPINDLINAYQTNPFGLALPSNKDVMFRSFLHDANPLYPKTPTLEDSSAKNAQLYSIFDDSCPCLPLNPVQQQQQLDPIFDPYSTPSDDDVAMFLGQRRNWPSLPTVLSLCLVAPDFSAPDISVSLYTAARQYFLLPPALTKRCLCTKQVDTNGMRIRDDSFIMSFNKFGRKKGEKPRRKFVPANAPTVATSVTWERTTGRDVDLIPVAGDESDGPSGPLRQKRSSSTGPTGRNAFEPVFTGTDDPIFVESYNSHDLLVRSQIRNPFEQNHHDQVNEQRELFLHLSQQQHDFADGTSSWGGSSRGDGISVCSSTRNSSYAGSQFGQGSARSFGTTTSTAPPTPFQHPHNGELRDRGDIKYRLKHHLADKLSALPIATTSGEPNNFEKVLDSYLFPFSHIHPFTVALFALSVPAFNNLVFVYFCSLCTCKKHTFDSYKFIDIGSITERFPSVELRGMVGYSRSRQQVRCVGEVFLFFWQLLLSHAQCLLLYFNDQNLHFSVYREKQTAKNHPLFHPPFNFNAPSKETQAALAAASGSRVGSGPATNVHAQPNQSSSAPAHSTFDPFSLELLQFLYTPKITQLDGTQFPHHQVFIQQQTQLRESRSAKGRLNPLIPAIMTQPVDTPEAQLGDENRQLYQLTLPPQLCPPYGYYSLCYNCGIKQSAIPNNYPFQVQFSDLLLCTTVSYYSLLDFFFPPGCMPEPDKKEPRKESDFRWHDSTARLRARHAYLSNASNGFFTLDPTTGFLTLSLINLVGCVSASAGGKSLFQPALTLSTGVIMSPEGVLIPGESDLPGSDLFIDAFEFLSISSDYPLEPRQDLSTNKDSQPPPLSRRSTASASMMSSNPHLPFNVLQHDDSQFSSRSASMSSLFNHQMGLGGGLNNGNFNPNQPVSLDPVHSDVPPDAPLSTRTSAYSGDAALTSNASPLFKSSRLSRRVPSVALSRQSNQSQSAASVASQARSTARSQQGSMHGGGGGGGGAAMVINSSQPSSKSPHLNQQPSHQYTETGHTRHLDSRPQPKSILQFGDHNALFGLNNSSGRLDLYPSHLHDAKSQQNPATQPSKSRKLRSASRDHTPQRPSHQLPQQSSQPQTNNPAYQPIIQQPNPTYLPQYAYMEQTHTQPFDLYKSHNNQLTPSFLGSQPFDFCGPNAAQTSFNFSQQVDQSYPPQQQLQYPPQQSQQSTQHPLQQQSQYPPPPQQQQQQQQQYPPQQSIQYPPYQQPFSQPLHQYPPTNPNFNNDNNIMNNNNNINNNNNNLPHHNTNVPTMGQNQTPLGLRAGPQSGFFTPGPDANLMQVTPINSAPLSNSLSVPVQPFHVTIQQQSYQPGNQNGLPLDFYQPGALPNQTTNDPEHPRWQNYFLE